jgi:hypothetical protein
MDNIIAGFKYKNAGWDIYFSGKAGCWFPAVV